MKRRTMVGNIFVKRGTLVRDEFYDEFIKVYEEGKKKRALLYTYTGYCS